MASILGRARRPLAARGATVSRTRRPASVHHRESTAKVAALPCNRGVSAGLKRFGALRAIVETREQAICCRVADARSTQRWSQVGQAARGSASPQARRGVEAELEKCPQDCSRSSHHLLASRHLQNARGPKPAKRLYAHHTSAAVHRKQGRVRNSAGSTRVQQHTAIHKSSSTQSQSGAAGWSRTPSTRHHSQ